MLNNQNDILLAFYGDDFTGSTDALEFICRAGATAVLFIEPPSTDKLKEFPGLNAYGVAGKTRSLPAGEIEAVLLPAFEKMKVTQARHVHYKNCSTFDSSPTVGSIGKAIDSGAAVFKNRLIPVAGGAPALGRYCLFGNLFARMGIGSNGNIYRLDRHPSMSKHPVTPADESDLRVHLGKQTSKKIALIDVLQQEQPFEKWNEHINDSEVVLLDALDEGRLSTIGAWMESQYDGANSLFSAGTSAIEMALGNYWNEQGVWQKVVTWKTVEKITSLLVISGSCSPVTAAQIEFALANGFEEAILDTTSVSNGEPVTERFLASIIDLLKKGQPVVVHTGNKQPQNLSAEKLGHALGYIARQCILQANIKRVIVSGGDTSSYAARAMEIDAVEMIAPLVIGAPLCAVHAANKRINGIEINFKGGQVGAEDYFVKAMG